MMISVCKKSWCVPVPYLCVFGIFSVIFFAIMAGVLGQQFLSLDQAVSGWMLAHQTPSASTFFMALTYLGEKNLLALLALLLAMGLWKKQKKIEAILFGGGFVGCMGGVYIIKTLIGRARPAVELVHETSGSFPSGHAAFSVFFFGFIAYLLVRGTQDKAQRLFVIAIALLLAGAVCVSRLYLNVHWLSDVVGGVCLATAALSSTIGAIVMLKDGLR